MRPERDNLLLVIGGTVAIHTILLVVVDAGGQYVRRHPHIAPPHIEVVDILPDDPPKPPDPPPPPPAPPEPAVAAPPPKVATHKVAPPPPPSDPVPPPPTPTDTPPDPNAGGAPVVAMQDVAPSAHGVSVAKGDPNRYVGQGGSGTGTGSGVGAGSAPAPKPVSVATIKTRAMPKGDYSFDAAKDYPPEARAQGIEGQIRVRLLVDASGKVAERRLLNKLGHGLDELALARAAKFEFDPAKDTDDRPVASVVVWTFTFTLPE